MKFLKKSELLDTVQIITVDPIGTIVDTDHNLFTWKKGTFIQDAHPFFHVLDSLRFEITENKAFNFPCIHLNQDTVERICDVDFKFKTKKTTIILYDFTDKYQELNHIAQQKNESLLKARELELKNRFLLEKEKFKNDFIANINHEIRTPLTSILGFIEVLERTKLEFEQRELTRIIKAQGDHLATMLDDMVDISKIESGTIDLMQQPFSFVHLINDLKESYAALAREKELQFEVIQDHTVPDELLGDRKRLYQILNNILDNAFKFTVKGNVRFTVFRNYQRGNKISLGFKIEDTGIGIEKEKLPEIFNRFSRFHNGRPIKGTGLGLAISKDLVDLMSGEVSVVSEPDRGTMFALKIPLKIEVRKIAVGRKKKKYVLPETKKKFRILLVEDEESTQFLIMKILLSHGNFFVDIAFNGKLAISYLERKNYDMVLLDLTLPDLDGYKITHKIRNHYGDSMISEVPIVGFTARATEREREKCLRSGMNDFIPKPFGREELLHVITKQIAKKAAL